MKVIIPIAIEIGEDARQELRRAINLHYLGDEECNKVLESGEVVGKYPDKETPAFYHASHNASACHQAFLEVEFSEKTGQPISIKEYEEE